jgi:ATP binding cassette subfamily A (ABC1) protein 13
MLVRIEIVLIILFFSFFLSCKTLIPSEANGLLKSLLDVVASLSSILARAQHALEYLPEFLHTFKITALLDMPDFQQVCLITAQWGKCFSLFSFLFVLFSFYLPISIIL